MDQPSLKKRILEKAKAARRPEGPQQVGPADLTPQISRPAAADYTGPSLSELKAAEKAKAPKVTDDPTYKRLSDELKDLQLDAKRWEAANSGKRVYDGASVVKAPVEDQIKRKNLEIAEFKRAFEKLHGPASDSSEDAPVGFASGGVVGRDHPKPSPTDTVKAMLTPGEEVLTPRDPRHRDNLPLAASGLELSSLDEFIGPQIDPVVSGGLSDMPEDDRRDPSSGEGIAEPQRVYNANGNISSGGTGQRGGGGGAESGLLSKAIAEQTQVLKDLLREVGSQTTILKGLEHRSVLRNAQLT